MAVKAGVAGYRLRTEGVTTIALAPSTRADTIAGLGTVDDVRLASRQEQVRLSTPDESGPLPPVEKCLTGVWVSGSARRG